MNTRGIHHTNDAYRTLYLSLLRKGQWEQIPPFPAHTANHYLFMKDIIQWIPCPTETVLQLLRFFPERTPKCWSTLLAYSPEFHRADLIHSFMERGMLDLNHNTLLYAMSRPSHNVSIEKQKETIQVLLEGGVDINEYDTSGRTPFIMEYLHGNLPMIETDDNIEVQLRIMLPWLLERGADPLLESRNGVNAIHMVQNMWGIRRSVKRWVIEELERWA